MDIVEIYTDGACSKVGQGGWGAVLKFNDTFKEIRGQEFDTTNNRMELTAVIEVLKMIIIPIPIIIYSDSAYIVNCINDGWYVKWQDNGWKNSKKESVENRDLWEQLLELLKIQNVSFVKVKGHSGNELNERADKLAKIGSGTK